MKKKALERRINKLFMDSRREGNVELIEEINSMEKDEVIRSSWLSCGDLSSERRKGSEMEL